MFLQITDPQLIPKDSSLEECSRLSSQLARTGDKQNIYRKEVL